MSESLKGKTAIVTGSSRGIGEAIAIKFGKLGANVIVNYSQSAGKAREVVKRIQEQEGAGLAVKAVWDIMRKQKWGRIINISSVLGITGEVGLAHYASTKAGQGGLTKVLSREGERYNIRVNAVLPGLTKTDGAWAAIPEEGRKKYDQYGRLCMPEDIAEVVAFWSVMPATKSRVRLLWRMGVSFKNY